jgi:hypothetical protein
MSTPNFTRIELDRNSSGHAFIGATEFDSNGYGVRSYVLSGGAEHVHDDIMARRFWDMLRLMGENVTHLVTPEFTGGG